MILSLEYEDFLRSKTLSLKPVFSSKKKQQAEEEEESFELAFAVSFSLLLLLLQSSSLDYFIPMFYHDRISSSSRRVD